MERAKIDNWPIIMAAYLAGSSAPELAQKFNVKLATVRQRILRGQWRQLRNNLVAKPDENTEIQAQAHAESSVRPRLRQKLTRLVDALPTPGKVSIKELKAHVDALRGLVESAEKCEDWGAGNSQRLVTVEILQGVTGFGPADVPALEIESGLPVPPADAPAPVTPVSAIC